MATIPSIAMIPSGYKAGKVYSVLPTNGDADLTFTRASEATRVDETGVIETIATGVPRLDYSDGGCPSLLVEPQRTNLVTYSNLFTDASWLKTIGGTGVESSVVSSSVLAPDGNNSFLVTLNSGTGTTVSDQAKVVKTVTGLTNGLTYSESIYLKGVNGGEQLLLGISNIGTLKVTLTTEWQRFTLTGVSGGTFNSVGVQIRRGISEPLNSYAQFYMYGSQLEAGSNATSYIPTVAGTVTRVLERASKTGLSNYIGQTEGVFYAEINPVNKGVNSMIQISNGTDFNALYFLSNSNTSIRVGVTTFQTSYFKDLTITENENIKIAIKYKVGEYPKAFLNGILHNIPFASGVNAPPVEFIFDRLNLSYWWSGFPFKGKIKNLQVFNTALSDLEIETITSYTSFEEMALALNYTIEITL